MFKHEEISTERRRQLILEIADGNFQVLPIMWHFEKYLHRVKMYLWLKKSNITGQKFLDIYAERGKSPMGMAKFIIGEINKERQVTIRRKKEGYF